MLTIHLLNREDRPRVQEFFRRYPPQISEHTFTNLFVWRQSRPIMLAETADSLLLLTKSTDERLIIFGPPVGPLTVHRAAELLGKDYGGAVRIPAELVTQLEQTGYGAVEDRDNADYVYRVKDLSELAGRRYAKKRNRLKKCLKAYHCEYENIDARLAKECFAMQERWCANRQCKHEPGLCHEFIAIQEALINFEAFGLIGGAIRINDEIQAFAIGEELHPGTLVWHFEKAMPQINGLGQVINQWFAKYGLADFEYVNREQDLGNPGLRQAKKSYFPDHLVEKYQALPDLVHLQPSSARAMCV